jgi:hypothetical protein
MSYWVAGAIIVGSTVAGGATGNALTNKATPGKTDLHTPLDIGKIISDARVNAEQNLANSQSLEAKYLPGTALLRAQSDRALSDQLTGNTDAVKARNGLLGQLGSANPLLKESASSILASLRQGGKLDPETQNAVMRGALQQSGTAGISGSGAARGLAARDLGLTSLSLLTQRQQAAQQAGATMSSDLIGRTSALNGAISSDVSRVGGIAGLIDARAMPESGLSAGTIADLNVAEMNASDQAAANAAQLKAQARRDKINSILGFATLGGKIGGSIAGAG